MNGQSKEQHATEMRALGRIENTIDNLDSSLAPTVEVAVGAALATALGNVEVSGQATTSEHINFLLARRKRDALQLHELRERLKKEKQEEAKSSGSHESRKTGTL